MLSWLIAFGICCCLWPSDKKKRGSLNYTLVLKSTERPSVGLSVLKRYQQNEKVKKILEVKIRNTYFTYIYLYSFPFKMCFSYTTTWINSSYFYKLTLWNPLSGHRRLFWFLRTWSIWLDPKSKPWQFLHLFLLQQEALSFAFYLIMLYMCDDLVLLLALWCDYRVLCSCEYIEHFKILKNKNNKNTKNIKLGSGEIFLLQMEFLKCLYCFHNILHISKTKLCLLLK